MTEVDQATEHPGEPDGFERLWTPHRMVYLGGQDKPATAAPDDCPFCVIPQRDDREGLIVHRGELVCPYRHIADYPDLTLAETAEVAAMTQQAMRVVRRASAPHGFNLGINQGAVAGAGIAAHLHQHVVPRWAGDANFLPVVGQTKAVPQLLDDTWQVVRTAWNELG